MNDRSKEVAQLLEDVQYLKKAVMQSNRIFRFISSKVLRIVYLASGLAILAFAGLFHWLIQYYGSATNIPGAVKGGYYGLLICGAAGLFRMKVQSIMKRVNQLGLALDLKQLFREVYTWNTLVTTVPFLVAIGLTVAFLVSQGLTGYLVPCLAILYGLLLFAALNFLYLTELVFGGTWLVLSGFAILFFMKPPQPLPAVCFSFGLGLIAMYLVSLGLGNQE